MSDAGAVALVDVAQLDEPEHLATAIAHALTTTGFLFVRGHGLEHDAERMFDISGGRFLLGLRRGGRDPAP